MNLPEITNYNNHLQLMKEAIDKTSGPVIEMGSGESTKWLRQYCKDRDFQSYESNREWADKTGAKWVKDWNSIYWEIVSQRPSVILIDHAPGERRYIDAILYCNASEYVVIHDTEPAAQHGYKTLEMLAAFKYHRHLTSNGAWATICSNYNKL